MFDIMGFMKDEWEMRGIKPRELFFFNLPSFDLLMLSVYRNIDWCSDYLDRNRKPVAFLSLWCNLIMIRFTNRLQKG